MKKTIDIPCIGYSVKADIYEGQNKAPILLSLIGRTSRRTKQQYFNFFPELADKLGITSVIFDYTGHGDSPFNLEDLTPAQHFLEVVTVFDWIKAMYPDQKVYVVGSSYGGFLATLLTEYRAYDGLILRAPAIYRSEDFYTQMKNLDLDATDSLRKDKKALAVHPLFLTASKFKKKTLLIIHQNDEIVHPETTEAYAGALKAEVVIAKGIPHSLDDVSQHQILAYNTTIYAWLEKQTQQS